MATECGRHPVLYLGVQAFALLFAILVFPSMLSWGAPSQEWMAVRLLMCISVMLSWIRRLSSSHIGLNDAWMPTFVQTWRCRPVSSEKQAKNLCVNVLPTTAPDVCQDAVSAITTSDRRLLNSMSLGVFFIRRYEFTNRYFVNKFSTKWLNRCRFRENFRRSNVSTLDNLGMLCGRTRLSAVVTLT